jgi:D-amino-acid dehydrogenase
MRQVTIIGGGVIGLSTAWELSRRGVDVTVLDSRAPGMAASSVNAGWVSPSLAGPVPAPGLVQTSLKWMLNPESPLFIRPRLNADFLRWLYRFWRSCQPAKYEAGLEATAMLGQDTMKIMDDWVAQGVDFEMHRYGLLFAYKHAEHMEADLKAFDKVTPYGYKNPPAYYGDDLRHVEPLLSEEIVSGYMVEEERTVQPVSLVKGLIAKLEEVGVTIKVGTPVVDIDVAGGRVTAVRTPSERIPTDAVMIAAGAWSRDIARLAGAKLPIEAGKGYGLDFKPAPVKPRSSIYLHDDRVAVSPFDSGLRLSGTMELSGITERFTERRINAIHKAGKRFLNGFPEDSEPHHVWTGMRPMAPDGLPVLGMMRGFSNLSVASGHAMLGVTLAAVTGVQMAELITTGRASDLLKPFSPDRFRGIL